MNGNAIHVARCRIAVAGLLVLSAALVAFILAPSSGRSSAERVGAVEKGAEDAHGGPTLRGAQDDASSVPLDLRGTGRIVGRVERAGAPVACTVTLHLVSRSSDMDPLGVWLRTSFSELVLSGGLASGAHLACRQTDDEGRFAFEELGPAEYEIRARLPGGRVARAPVELLASGGSVEVVLRLLDGGMTLRGRVLLDDGAAFRGTLIIQPVAKEKTLLIADGAIVFTTGSDGGFAVADLSPGAYEVFAFTPGRLRARLGAVRVPRAEPVELRLPHRVLVRGRVLDDETSRPLAGAQVTFAGEEFMGKTGTDGEGRFEIGVARATALVLVEAPGYAAALEEWERISAQPVEVRLLRAGRIVGTVRERGTGNGVADVWVFAFPHSKWSEPGGMPAAARTDTSGRFELNGVQPGIVSVVAFGGGWCSTELTAIGAHRRHELQQDVPPAAAVNRDVEVVPSARLVGSVVSATGEPVSGAVVHVGAGFPGCGDLGMLRILEKDRLQAATDREGRFELRSLPPDSRRFITVQSVGHPEWRGVMDSGASGETVRLDIQLAAPRWLDVTVRSTGGVALAGARVQLGVRFPRGDRAKSTWTTDAEGHVRAGPLPPGEIYVIASAAGHQTEILERSASVWGPAVLVLEPGSTLAGRVRLPPGVPGEALQVEVKGDAQPDRDTFERSLPVASDGTWRVDGVPDVHFRLTVTGRWKGRYYRGVAHADAGDVKVEIEATTEDPVPHELVLRVVDPSGRPVGSGMVAVHPRPEPGLRSRRALLGGRAVLEVFEVHSPLWIEVWGAPADRCGATVFGPVADIPDEITIQLEPPRTIEGVVQGPAGVSLRGIEVGARVLDEHGNAWHEHATTTTDDQGRFLLRGLGERAYRVEIASPSDLEDPGHQVARGGATGIVFDLSAKNNIEITVLDADGEPVVGAHVSAMGWDHTLSAISAITNKGGVAGLRGLRLEDRYRLDVTRPAGRRDLSEVTHEDWEPRDTTLRLERLYRISGRVVDHEGKPAAGAAIRYRPAGAGGHWSVSGQSHDEGRFRIEDLEQGKYEVAADAGARTSDPRASTRASAGDVDVQLRVDLRFSLTVRVPEWPDGAYMLGELRAEGDGRALVAQEYRYGPGTLRFEGLDGERTYGLRICSDESKWNQYVLETGLRPGSTRVDLVTRVGGAITGRVRHPSDLWIKWGGATVRVGEFEVWGPFTGSGHFTLSALPEGSYEITVSCGDELDARWTASVKAATGDTLSINLVQR